MRIGLDARFLTHPQRGGFKTYTVNLVSALARVDRTNDYVVYLDREPLADETLPAVTHVDYRVVHGTLPLLGMPLREQIGLRRAIARDQLDLIHFLCNTGTVGIRTPHVLTLHDRIQLESQRLVPSQAGMSIHHRAQMAYSQRSILPVLRTAARVITVSDYERQQLATSLSIPLDRITVTHEAADPIFVRADTRQRTLWRTELAQRYHIQTPFILAVGYEERKNLPLLMEAFAGLTTTHPHVTLVIVAANSHARESLRIAATQAGIHGRVVLLGATAPSELVRLYNGAEVFAFPSEQEGFGLPPLEALACGTPTIVLRATSVPEIVGNAAVMLDSLEPHVWSATLKALLNDPGYCDRLSKGGVERAAAFSWNRCAEQTVRVYHGVRAETSERTGAAVGGG